MKMPAVAQTANRELACKQIALAIMLGPTTSGNQSEANANANIACANCMAGLPVLQQQQ